MADPISEFAALLEAVDLPEGLNIYTTPPPQLVPPAIVLRPDTPWMEQNRFCYELERYVAIAVVQSSTSNDGILLLRELSLAILSALVPPWDWESVDGPVIDDSTGTAYLANRVRLKYKNGGPS